MTDKSVKVYLKGDISDYNRAMLEAEASTKGFTKSLDSSNDRMSNLVQSSLALGPALVPISAAAVPTITGLTNQLGIGVAAVGVSVLAFKGLGKALDAVNKASIEPTAANLQNMHDQMLQIGPAGQDFVLFLQKARPEIQALQELSRAGLFPGVEKGLHSLGGLLPDVERVITTISTTLGDLAAEGGANLDSPKWHEFIDFLNSEARPTLLAMGRTVGNLGEGFANLWMAFSPLSNSFSQDFLGLARDFAKWTDGLDKTQGFQNFLDYVSTEGPAVFDTLGSIGNALVQIVEAAAPVGSAALPVIKAVSDAVATLADSDLGPVIIGVVSLTSAFTRLKALSVASNTGPLGSQLGKALSPATFTGGMRQLANLTVAQDRATLSAKNLGRGLVLATGDPQVRAGFGQFGKYAVGAAGLGLVMSGTADKMGLANTASLALAGSLFGPWGAAVGGGIGLTKDLANANDGLWSAVSRANAVLGDSRSSLQDQAAAVEVARQKVIDLEEAVNSHTPTPNNVFKSLKDGTEGLFGKSDIEEANSALKALESQQSKNINKAQDLAFSEAGLSTSMYGATQAARDQADAVLKLLDAHNKLDDENLAAANANIAYEQALDNAAEGARKNKKGLDDNLPSGRANLSLLYTLAGSWNGLTAEQQNAAGASDRARSQFIKIAEVMGATAKEAKALADKYLDVPTDVSTHVHLYGAAPATREAQALTRALQKIPGLTTAKIRTIEETFIAPKKSDPKPSLTNMLKPASGGHVTGAGGPTDDMIPAMLSNGEFVMNAASTARFLPELHAMNAGRFAVGGPVMRGYANGGTVSSAPAMQGGFTARLVDPTVRVHKNGLVELMDDRVEIGVSTNNVYRGKRK